MAAVSLLQKWDLLQAITADPNLTLVAKVIAARILGHHNGQTGQCSPSYDTLAKGAGLERRSAIRAVQELERAGWISVTRVSGGSSEVAKGFVTNSFRLHLSRLEPSAPRVPVETLPPGASSDTPPSDRSDTPSGDSLDTPPGVSPDTPGVSDQSPPGVSGQSPKHMKPEHMKGTREESISRASRPGSKFEVDEQAFDELYQAYPRKVGRDKAREAYAKVVGSGRATHAELLTAAQRFSTERAGQDPTFTPHPATWLNQGRWTDEALDRSKALLNGAGAPRHAARGGFSATRDWLMARLDAND